MESGASRLRRTIMQLQSRTIPGDLVVTQIAPDRLRIEKRTTGSENRTEFAFILRVEGVGFHEQWWPIEYKSATEVISCESVVNGRVLVNLVKQRSLIELAETWARTIEAQQTARSVGSALM